MATGAAVAVPLQLVQLVLTNGTSNGTDAASCVPDAEGTGDIVVGFLLLAGIAISFMPQYYEVIAVGSSFTLSEWTLFIQVLNGYATMVNGFLLTFWDRYQCCHTHWGSWECVVQTQGFNQLVAQWLFQLPVFGLFYVHLTDEHSDRRKAVAWRLLWTAIAVNVLITVACALILALGDAHSRGADIFAEAMGIVALFGTIVQWAPQIWTTFRAKTAGAISIPSLLIQAPGSGLFAYFQIFPQREHWTTWIGTVVNTIEMLILLFLCVYYTCKERRARAAALAAGDADPLVTDAGGAAFPNALGDTGPDSGSFPVGIRNPAPPRGAGALHSPTHRIVNHSGGPGGAVAPGSGTAAAHGTSGGSNYMGYRPVGDAW